MQFTVNADVKDGAIRALPMVWLSASAAT